MEDFKLVRITPQNLNSFGVYISPDLHQYVKDADNIVIGCVYKDYACGAALTIYENDRKFHLLSLYVDEKVRGMGFGKQLLLGTVGMAKDFCGDTLYICYSKEDLCGQEIHPIFEHVGFEGPLINGLTYLVKWKDLKNIDMFKDIDENYNSSKNIIQFNQLNQDQINDYRKKIKDETIPSYLGVRAAKGDIIPELTLAAVDGNEVTGIFVMTRIEEYVYINSVYTIPGKLSTFLPLIKTAVSKAHNVLNDDDIIKVTAVNDISKQLNGNIFEPIAEKIEEEYLYEYYID